MASTERSNSTSSDSASPLASGVQDDDIFSDPSADPEEMRVVLNTLNSFLSYRRMAHYNVTHIRRQSFYAMPLTQWSLLSQPPFSILAKFDEVDNAIDANADIAEAALQTALQYFKFPAWSPLDKDLPPWHAPPDSINVSKAYTTIRQLYRDWSAEGKVERDACYAPVVEALNSNFSSTPIPQRGHIKILVPGAGLGRLPLEICKAGYAVEGNEISYHMIIVSNHILNHSVAGQQYKLYPWAFGFSNHLRREHQLQCVMVPDVHPGTELNDASKGMEIHAFDRLSMSSSDFCVAYRQPEAKEAYDAVATVFFVDTAPNIIAYIETARHCLRPGGIWINVGPLLWHFENNAPGAQHEHEHDHDDTTSHKPHYRPLSAIAEESSQLNSSGSKSSSDENLGIGDAGSVELTDEEVTELLTRFGFTVERHERGNDSGYIQNPNSMLQSTYRTSIWIARKTG